MGQLAVEGGLLQCNGRTGAVARRPVGDGVRGFPVNVEGNDVLVEVD